MAEIFRATVAHTYAGQIINTRTANILLPQAHFQRHKTTCHACSESIQMPSQTSSVTGLTVPTLQALPFPNPLR